MSATFAATSSVDVNDAANFIPEIWSDEIIAAFKENLVLANRVTNLNHQGRKGDTIHVPSPTRGNASAKSANAAVTLITNTEGVTDISIDKHFEYSRLIEDIVRVQGLDSLRRFYTDDAGHALAKMVDWHLHVLGTGLQGSTVDTSAIDTPGGSLTYNSGTASAEVNAVIGSDGTTKWDPSGTGNGATITDAGIRKMMQTLDDADVPLTDRSVVIPPVEKNSMLGIARFTEQAFVGEAGGANSLRSGLIGDVYGAQVFVSTNAGATTNTSGTTSYRAGMIIHRSALALVTQLGVRVQTQYKQEFLSDLMTADTIYGTGELRDDGGVVWIAPA